MTLRLILIVSTFSVFLGRAWQHIRWDGPYRTLFWDEELFGPVVGLFSTLTWNEYVTSTTVDQAIEHFTHGVGVLFLITAFVSLIPNQKKGLHWPIMVGTILLGFMVLCVWKDRFYQIGQLMEHSCQIAAPILLIRWRKKAADRKWLLVLKIAISLTFIGHGLYAVGYHPQPGAFNDMLINIFGMTEATANTVLIVAGILDFVCAIAIWLPINYTAFVWYLIIWGLLTALARMVSGFSPGLLLYTLEQTWHESVFRLAHGLLPVLLLPRFQKSISLAKI